MRLEHAFGSVLLSILRWHAPMAQREVKAKSKKNTASVCPAFDFTKPVRGRPAPPLRIINRVSTPTLLLRKAGTFSPGSAAKGAD